MSFETLVGEHLGLSVGGAIALVGGGLHAAASLPITLPIRATYLFASRPEDQLARRGFAVFIEVAPGVPIAGAPGRDYPGYRPGPFFAVTGALGVSYVWW